MQLADPLLLRSNCYIETIEGKSIYNTSSATYVSCFCTSIYFSKYPSSCPISEYTSNYHFFSR